MRVHTPCRAEACHEKEDPEKKAEVADPVDDKRLLARVRGAVPLVPEADEEIGAQPHAFPAHEHEEYVVRRHEGEHHEDEEVEIREVAGKALVIVHVSGGIDVDEEADARDHEAHDDRKGVYPETHARGELTRDDPVECVHLEDARIGGEAQEVDEDDCGYHERSEQGEACHPRNHRLGHFPPEEGVDEEAGGGECGYEPDIVSHLFSP